MQALRAKQLYSETELQNFALQVMNMLRSDGSGDAQALVSYAQYEALCFSLISSTVFHLNNYLAPTI